MHSRNHFLFLALVVVAILPLRSAQAEDKASILAKLDTAARGFHTTTATVEFDSIQTDPVPDKDIMTGTAYYERNSHLEMAVHFTAHISNGKSQPTAKAYIFSNGTLRVSDTGKEKDAKPYDQAGKYESYFALGFGASGKDLEEKWTIAYLGKDTIDGISTDKLELVAKDPNVRKNISKVTVWMDTARAVSLKVIFDEGEGQSYVCHYTNIKVNQSLPKSAFNFDK
jgi:outer membrane lipoprotein-sorting protein